MATDKEKFTVLIEAMASTFGKTADKAMLLGYWMALQDIPLPILERAVTHALKTSTFAPKPAELREACGILSPAKQAALACVDVERALSTCGYYNSPNFEDAAINATIRALGGWMRVCDLQEEEFSKWYRKDFERLYAIYVETGVGQEAGQPLLGYYEQQNRIGGYDHPTVVQISSSLPQQVKLERFDKQQAIQKNGTAIPRIEFRKP